MFRNLCAMSIVKEVNHSIHLISGLRGRRERKEGWEKRKRERGGKG